jgi:hypothetical protein
MDEDGYRRRRFFVESARGEAERAADKDARANPKSSRFSPFSDARSLPRRHLTTIAMLARRGGGLARRGVTQVSASSPASERRGDGANVAGDALARTRASRAFSASSRARDASRPPSARDRMSVASAFEYCATRVRQLDYENYLCALFLPREHRPAALALRAFNAETASALGATKEPQLALMRLKWWRDAVDAAHDADEDLPPGPPRGDRTQGCARDAECRRWRSNQNVAQTNRRRARAGRRDGIRKSDARLGGVPRGVRRVDELERFVSAAGSGRNA